MDSCNPKEEAKEPISNRDRAKAFRERRKQYIDTLENKIESLERIVERLTQENNMLKSQSGNEIKVIWQ